MAWANDGVASGFSVTWSVAIEEWFYLIFPWVVVAAPRQSLPKILIVLALGSAFGRAIFYFTNPGLSYPPYVLMPFRLDGLAAGGLLALAYRRQTLWERVARARAVVWAMTVVLVVTTPLLIGLVRNSLASNMFTWGHSYLSLTGCFMLTCVLLFEGSSRLRVLRSRLLTLAGSLSYTLYLIHPLVLSFLFSLVGRREIIDSAGDAVLALLAFLIAAAASWLSYRIIERPIQEAGRKKFTYKRLGEQKVEILHA